jgi:hypothetical protein
MLTAKVRAEQSATFIDVRFTGGTLPTGRALAEKPIELVDARAAVTTRIACALIDVQKTEEVINTLTQYTKATTKTPEVCSID